LGTPNAGKSSLLYRLYSGIFYERAPKVATQSIEQARVDNILLRALNIQEKKISHDEWNPIARNAIAIIFVLDVSNDQGIEEGIALYKEITQLSTISGVPQAILGNKIDIRPYLAEVLRDQFHSRNAWNPKFKPLVFCISVLTTDGLRKSMDIFMRKSKFSFHIPVFREK